jgi:hypothetical protein
MSNWRSQRLGSGEGTKDWALRCLKHSRNWRNHGMDRRRQTHRSAKRRCECPLGGSSSDRRS